MDLKAFIGATYQYIVLGFAVALIVAFLVVLIIWLVKRKKQQKNEAAFTEFQTKLVLALGGFTNILDARLNHSRLEVQLKNIKDINQKEILDMKLGAVVTGNTIKMFIKENAKEVYKYIKKAKKEE